MASNVENGAVLSASELKARFHTIVGSLHVRPAEPADTGAGVAAQVVVAPGNEREVAAVLRFADDAGLAVMPRGGGTKLGWGNPPERADLILSLVRLDQVMEHAWADLTVTVQAGCRIATLQQTLAQYGQRLAIDVLWPEQATVGGILACNDSGVLRLRYGGLRDLIIGVTLALPDGTLAASGGKVVKNVAGYDLPKLATGALGTLGVITQATFRLHPVPHHERTRTIHCQDFPSMQQLVLAIQDASLAHAALQVRLGSHAAPEGDVLLEGTEAGIGAQDSSIRQIVGSVPVVEATQDVWNARQAMWVHDHDDSIGRAIAKISLLPADLASTFTTIDRLAAAHDARWMAVAQATGLGQLRLVGNAEHLPGLVLDIRDALEARGGSLVMLEQPRGVSSVEVWGNPNNTLPLMRALKQQLDPRRTLNPGRFVGGI
jgi:glycolate oxidase FAD binding subunit